MRLGRDSLLRLGFACAFLFAIVVPGTAQAGFAPGNETIVEGEIVSATGLGSDAQGNSLVAWSEMVAPYYTEARARRVSVTGDVGPVIDLSNGEGCCGIGEGAQRPAVAMTPAGRAFVAWHLSKTPPQSDSIKGRWVEPDGTLGPILTLVQAGIAEPGSPQAVVDPFGVVTVAWQSGEALQLRRVAPDGTLGPLVEDVAGGLNGNPVIAALANGSTLAAWRDSDAIEKNVVTAAGVVGTPTTISEAGTARDVDVATGPDGGSLVVWRLSTGDTLGDYSVRGRRLDPAGAPVGPEIVVDPLQKGVVAPPQVAADGEGNFLVGWNRRDAGHKTSVFARGLNGAGAFAGPKQLLSTPGINATDEAPVLLNGGVGVLAWEEEAAAMVGRTVDGAGSPTGAAEQLFPGGISARRTSSVPAAGFAAFLIEYPVSGALQGAVLRRFLPPPTCAGAEARVVEGKPVTIPITCTGLAVEGAQVLEQPRHGSVGGFDLLTSSFLYTPEPGYEGTDSFTFAGFNDGGSSTPVRVTIAVGKKPVLEDTVKPKIGKLRFVRKGMKFRFALSEPARVEIRVKSVRRIGGKRRIKLLGKAAAPQQGALEATVKVRGKLARKLAAGGRFQAIAVATDAAGNRSAPKRIAFELQG